HARRRPRDGGGPLRIAERGRGGAPSRVEPASTGPMSEPRRVTVRSRLAIGEEQFLLLIAVLIGIYSGLAVVGFRLAIEWLRLTLLGPALVPRFARVIVVPTVVGLVVAALVVRLFPAVRGSGVNQTKAALYIYDGFIPFRTVVGKFLTSALAIGSGQ